MMEDYRFMVLENYIKMKGGVDSLENLKFNIKKISDNDDYYGFTISDDNLYLTSDNLVHHNSGKSVLEQSINF